MRRGNVRSNRDSLGLLLLVPMLVLAGCGPQSALPGTLTTKATPTQDVLAVPQEIGTLAAGEASAAVSLTVGDAAAFQALLARYQGQVVLVDFWATWCAPCVEQFPHTVQLDQQHRAQGLAVISVSMDEPADRDKVLQFLQAQNAAFDNLLGKYGVGAEFADAFGIRGEVPFYRLYDRRGQLRYQFMPTRTDWRTASRSLNLMRGSANSWRSDLRFCTARIVVGHVVDNIRTAP